MPLWTSTLPAFSNLGDCAKGYFRQLRKASGNLAWAHHNSKDIAPFGTSLYGLRVAAAADAYFADLGFRTNAESEWRNLKKMTVGIGEAVNRALDNLGENLKVNALGRHPDFTILDEGGLITAVSILDRMDLTTLTPLDLPDLSDALDWFIEVSEDLHDSRPSVTLQNLNRLLAGLLLQEGREARTVYDPTCGYGGSLLAVHDELKVSNVVDGVRFYGQDLVAEAISVTAWRFLLRGVTNFELAVGDTLASPRFLDGRKVKRFDLVISVPNIYPTASANMTSEDPYVRFSYGDVGRGRADYGFVQHVLASTAPTGRAITTLALSSLARSGYEHEIRGRMVRADLLETVISFPEIIEPHAETAGAPSSAMVFDFAKSGSAKDKVFFVDGDKFAEMITNSPVLSSKTIESIRQTYQSKYEAPDFTVWAQLDSIQARDYSLLPVLYIPQISKVIHDVQTTEKRIKELSEKLYETQKDLDAAVAVFSTQTL